MIPDTCEKITNIFTALVVSTVALLPRKRVSRALVAVLVNLAVLHPTALQAQEVITNPNVTVVPDDRQTLRAIFSMRLRRWPDGTPIAVFVLPTTNPLHVAFCKEVLGVFPHQLQRAWDRLVFSGTGQAPVVVDSTDEMRQRVQETPGAIGYIQKDNKQ